VVFLQVSVPEFGDLVQSLKLSFTTLKRVARALKAEALTTTADRHHNQAQHQQQQSPTSEDGGVGNGAGSKDASSSSLSLPSPPPSPSKLSLIGGWASRRGSFRNPLMSAFGSSREEEEEYEDDEEDEEDEEDEDDEDVDGLTRTQKKKIDSLTQAADLLNRAFESVAQERSSGGGGMINLLGNSSKNKTPVRVTWTFNFQLLILCWLVDVGSDIS
jgi:hypothetical protein